MNITVAKKLDEHTELIERYARVALKKIMKPAKYTLEDLIQEGVLAFLYAEKEFIEGRGTAFRTWLITCLRNRFASLIKQSYHHKEINNFSFQDSFQSDRIPQETDLQNKKNITMDTIEISSIIRSLRGDELKYINAMLSLIHKPKGGRRKAARENLRISYEREIELRNSIWDKIRK